MTSELLIALGALIVGVLLGVAISRWLGGNGNDELAQSQMTALAERMKNELREANASLAHEQREQFLQLADQQMRRVGDTNSAKLSELVGPVREKLTEFDALVRTIETTRVDAFSSLTQRIDGLAVRESELHRLAATLSTKTGELATALRNPATRGRWGEIQLRRVVELAGMEEHIHFDEQETIGDGNRSRPDMTVALPNDGAVYIDAKVPLDAYLNAVECTDDTERHRQLAIHAKTIRKHIDDMVSRPYEQANKQNPVVIFIPVEAALSAACIEEPDMIEKALARGIYVTSPITLLALLRAFAFGWQQVRQEENVRKIGELATELFGRTLRLVTCISDIGKAVTTLNDRYNTTVGSFNRFLYPKGKELAEFVGSGKADLERLKENKDELKVLRPIDEKFAALGATELDSEDAEIDDDGDE